VRLELVTSNTDDNDDREFFRATQTVLVTTAPSEVAQLLDVAAAQPGARILQLSTDLSPQLQSGVEARLSPLAIADAMRQAELQAQAAHVRLGALSSLQLSFPRPGPRLFAATSAATPFEPGALEREAQALLVY